MELPIILWTSVFRGIGLPIQKCREKVTNNQGLGCDFHIWVGSQFPLESAWWFPLPPCPWHTDHCLSTESSCEEFKGVLSRGASPRNGLHVDCPQNFNAAKLTIGHLLFRFFSQCKNICHPLWSTFATTRFVFASRVMPRGKIPVLILFLVWHLASMCTDRERKKKRGFTFSLFTLMHSMKRKPKINNENHGLQDLVESLHQTCQTQRLTLAK